MSKTFLPYAPEQQLLLPVAVQEWQPQDHLAYFISDVVDQLDLSAITGLYEEQRGVKALLTALNDPPSPVQARHHADVAAPAAHSGLGGVRSGGTAPGDGTGSDHYRLC